MARVLRYVVVAGCVTSLLFCVAACALWIDSYWVGGRFRIGRWSHNDNSTTDSYLTGYASAGGIKLDTYSRTWLFKVAEGQSHATSIKPQYGFRLDRDADYRPSYPMIRREMQAAINPEIAAKFASHYDTHFDHWATFAGFKIETSTQENTNSSNWFITHEVEIVLPLWSVVFLTAIAPFFFGWRVRQRRRARISVTVASTATPPHPPNRDSEHGVAMKGGRSLSSIPQPV